MNSNKAFCILLCGYSQLSVASVTDWHVNGFLSQSLLSTTDNAFLGDTDDRISLDYREAALIVNGELLKNVRLSSQLLSRKAGVGDDGTPRVDYAFLTWRTYDSTSFTHSLVVGKLKVPTGFYNETRDSPFTRNGVFLPQGTYFDRLRNTTMAAEEVMYVGEFRNDLWVYNFKLGSGKTLQDQKEISDVYRTPETIQGKFSNPHAWHAQLSADYDGGRLRLAYSEYSAPEKFEADFQSMQLEFTTDIKYRIVSIEYNELLWSVTMEAFRARLDYPGIGAVGRGTDLPESYYLQASFRPIERWEFFLRFDTIVMDANDPNGKKFVPDPGKNFFQLPGCIRFSDDIATGFSFRPTDKWLLRGEFHNIHGTTWMTARDLPDFHDQVEYWNLLAFSASWRF